MRTVAKIHAVLQNSLMIYRQLPNTSSHSRRFIIITILKKPSGCPTLILLITKTIKCSREVKKKFDPELSKPLRRAFCTKCLPSDEIVLSALYFQETLERPW